MALTALLAPAWLLYKQSLKEYPEQPLRPLRVSEPGHAEAPATAEPQAPPSAESPSRPGPSSPKEGPALPPLLLRGLRAYERGQLEEARLSLQGSLREHRSPLALKLLAFIAYRQEELQEALEYAQEALSIRRDKELEALLEHLRKEQKIRGDALSEVSAHFEVLYNGAVHGGLSRTVLQVLEEAYREVGAALGHYPLEPIKVVLYEKEGFHALTGRPHWVGGLYDGLIRLPLGDAPSEPGALRRVLFHEYTHALVHDLLGGRWLPLWFHEGLAEYLSLPGGARGTHQVIPLQELEHSFEGLSEAQVRTAYVESYSAVRYLIQRHGLHSVGQMLQDMAQGADFHEAFEAAFWMSYQEFLHSWGKGEE